MSEQEKKQKRIYDSLIIETKFLCLLYAKQRIYLQKKTLLRKSGCE